jgi:hypothetical protein
MDLTKEAIEKIEDLAKPNYENHAGIRYCDKKLYKIDQFELSPMFTDSLDSLVAYCDEMSPEERDTFLINAKSKTHVELVKKEARETGKRDSYLVAIPELPEYRFGNYIQIESMIISLKTQFVSSDSLDELVQILGNITDSEIRTVADDGISQKVNVSAGITLQEGKQIPLLIDLKPFRTFREIEQPASSFLIRLRKGHDGPQAALFEADGGQWSFDAAEMVREYIKQELEHPIQII